MMSNPLRRLAEYLRGRPTVVTTSLPEIQYRPRHSRAHSTVAGAYDDAFDYEDPQGNRYLPPDMDGVIQIQTPEQVATNRAYRMALEDPMSVVGPDRHYADISDDERVGLSLLDLGHRLEMERVSEHHDPERLARIKAGLGLSEVKFTSLPDPDRCPNYDGDQE